MHWYSKHPLPTTQENPARETSKTRKREWLPTPVCLPGESHGQRSLSLAVYSPWGQKESDRPEPLALSLHFHHRPGHHMLYRIHTMKTAFAKGGGKRYTENSDGRCRLRKIIQNKYCFYL